MKADDPPVGSRFTPSPEWLLLGVILVVAFIVRVYHLGSFPDTVLADEADNVQAAVRILHGLPPVNGFFGVDWTPQPAFSVYKEAAFISVMGLNITAMRISSAALSTLALIPFYLLLRRQCSTPASLSAVVLLATNVWFLNFSRSGWNNVDVCLYMLLTMYMLCKALDAVQSSRGENRRVWISFAATGFFAALGLYGYPSGRAITLGVLAFLPVALFFQRPRRRLVLLGYVVLIAVEIAVFAPQADYAARHWEAFNQRTRVVSILNDPAYKADRLGTMVRQVRRNAVAPWDGSVNNTPQYFPVGRPQLERVTGFLVLLGMVGSIALGRLRNRPETWLWWLMLLSGWVVTQILTVGSPNGARGVGYMPALIFFSALAIDLVGRAAVRMMIRAGLPAKQRRLLGRASVAVLGVMVVTIAVANVRHYVNWQRDPRTREARYLYVTQSEFPEWASTIRRRASVGGGELNVGQWRRQRPIRDRANPR